MENPYEVQAEGSPFPHELVSTLSSLEEPQPRIWPSLLLPLISLATFLTVSSIMIVVAYYAVHGELNVKMMTKPEGMQSVYSSRLGLLLLVLVPQIALVAPTILAAWLSPVPTLQRLSLVRGHWPIWLWVTAAFATPLIGWISSIAVSSLMGESENLQMLSGIFRKHGESGFLIPLALLIGATPALCEEFLFRGFVQTRLTQRVGAPIGILLASSLFALFHLDWVHIVAVLPLGLFLGFVSWRSGSLLPAMLAHFVNNSISVVAVVLGPEDSDVEMSPEQVYFLASVLLLSLIGMVLTAVGLWFHPMPKALSKPLESRL